MNGLRTSDVAEQETIGSFKALLQFKRKSPSASTSKGSFLKKVGAIGHQLNFFMTGLAAWQDIGLLCCGGNSVGWGTMTFACGVPKRHEDGRRETRHYAPAGRSPIEGECDR